MTLIIRPAQKPRDGDFVVVYYEDTDEATLREISIDGRTTVVLSLTSRQKRDFIDETIQII
ncbi:MAG: hypothetical protein KIT27_03620 [Legionellales bacterium]|nr:hypothetical protein [Legionellales bacterium]